jgi:hypothetical protein
MWEIILAVIVVAVVVAILDYKKCSVICGRKYDLRRENMTAGLGTVNALSLYNHANNCHEGNAMGSSSPFCTTTGYVLT